MSALGTRGPQWVACAAVLMIQVCIYTAIPVTWSLNLNRKFHADSIIPATARIDLMHRDHEGAPSAQKYASSIHRFRDANLRSRARFRILKKGRSRQRDLREITTPLSRSESSDILGDYYMSVSLGTPPVTFAAVLMDTGSDLTWVGCSPCRQCKKLMKPLLDPKMSSSFNLSTCSDKLCKALIDDDFSSCKSSEKTCPYAFVYGDSSGSQGYLASETITVTTTTEETQPVPHFRFGCSHEIEVAEEWDGSQGVAGMGRGPLSIPSQLSSVLGSVFTYCLLTAEHAVNKTSPLLFGKSSIPATGMNYTPLLYNKKYTSYYYLELEGISVGNSPLSIPHITFQFDSLGNGGTVIDSGTQLSILTAPAYDALIQELKKYLLHHEDSSNEIYNTCYNIKGVDKPVFPTITFHFSGADMVFADHNSFISIDDKTVCLSILRGEDGPPAGPSSIVGSVQQQNFLISFDTHPPQIGFIRKQCGSE